MLFDYGEWSSALSCLVHIQRQLLQPSNVLKRSFWELNSGDYATLSLKQIALLDVVGKSWCMAAIHSSLRQQYMAMYMKIPRSAGCVNDGEAREASKVTE